MQMQFTPCGCGCGQVSLRGKPFVRGHHARVHKAGITGRPPNGQTPIRSLCLTCATPVNQRRDKFCSHVCYVTFRSEEPDGHFWRLSARTVGDGCWLWQGDINHAGYGRLHIGGRKGRQVLAHRYSYELHYGPLPPGINVCHKCDERYPKGDFTYRRCVHPDHLFAGTQADNIADAIAKGRLNMKGEANPQARLSIESVRAIRDDMNSTLSELAARFGVSKATAWRVRSGHGWRSVTPLF